MFWWDQQKHPVTLKKNHKDPNITLFCRQIIDLHCMFLSCHVRVSE